MNSKERMQIAMNLGTPDRVPVMCQLSIGHYFLNGGLSPLDIWFTSEGFAKALVNLQQRYKFDGILINIPGRPPEYKQYVDHVEENKDLNETKVFWKNGNYTTVPHNDNPHYFMADGSRHFPTFEEVDPETLFYVEPFTLSDITYPFTWDFDTEPRPFDDFFPPYRADILKNVKAQVGDEVSVHTEIFSPFSQILELLNYENALMGMLTDPDKIHRCLERLTLGTIELACLDVKEGADAILISSAFAGAGFISRDMYKDFVLPYEKKVIAETKRRCNNIPFYTHTCGAIGDRLDLMMESGLNGIDTLDPPPLGTIELDDAVKQLKGNVFIKGNLDSVNTLLNGSKEDVEEAVKYRLKTAAPGGGYILSTACSVAPGVNPEYLEMLVKLVQEHGRY
ncbi:MAG: hypothetical protein HQK83_19065 [Fibrobacteria bacterium]|nr:hypothetical protein [Fibrobacteria bacterium]